MDLKELGRLLKEERLRQGLDLAEVMKRTKISRVSLEAVEEGNEQALPHPVYVKGFVKNYARFLGLDADKIGNSLTQVYSSEKVLAHEDDLALMDVRKLPAVKSQWPRQLGLLVLCALLVAVLAGVWLFRAPLQGTFVSVLELVGFLSKPVPEAVPAPEPVLPELGLPFDHGEIVGEPGMVSKEEAGPAAPSTPSEIMTELRAADDGAAQGERILEIRAFANCWLSAQADGGRVREAFLRPGERLVVSFDKYLDLRLGNAGGVELFLDGKPWPLRARSGEVLTLRLP